MPKFRNGQSVIVVHDDHELKMGDICVVKEAQTMCCGNVIVDKSPYHHEPRIFEEYNGEMPKEYIIGIDKEIVFKVMDRLMISGTLASINGMVQVEHYKQEMLWALEKLGIHEEWRRRHV